MASRQVENEIQKNLKKTGFARINGELHEKKKNKINYNITASKDTPYSIDASNVHTGENLKLTIKGQNGNVIAKATHSHGSKNPHLTFIVDKKQNVKVIIQVEDDKNNKGRFHSILLSTNTIKFQEANLIQTIKMIQMRKRIPDPYQIKKTKKIQLQPIL